MKDFQYQAINETGNTVSGVVKAESREAATNIILARGYIPSTIKEGDAGGGELRWSGLRERLSSVKVPDLILFSKQFRTMMRAGVSILRLLQILEEQTENLKLKRVVGAMADDIKEGNSLYEAFSKHPKVFSHLYSSMVRAGEASGSLPEVMERLIYILSHEHKIKTDIRSALQYPVLVLIFLGVAFLVLLTFVIPKFVTIFTRAGLELPLPTRICMFLYEFLKNYWPVIIIGLVVGLVLLTRYVRTRQGKYVKDTLLMKLPIMGPLFIKAAMSRFASIFAILQASGVAILDSIQILSGTIGNSAIAREFEGISDRLEKGQGIAEPLRSARYFTPMVINMVAVGEESGNLDEMLGEIAAHYDSEVEYTVSRLSELIGPILIVSLAGVVGFFALSIFLPMWDLMKMVK